MANIKSAEKKARQALVRKDRNQKIKSEVRTAERKLRDAITSKDKSKTEELFKNYSSVVMKAAKRGVVSTQTASRKIGRLAVSINKI